MQNRLNLGLNLEADALQKQITLGFTPENRNLSGTVAQTGKTSRKKFNGFNK